VALKPMILIIHTIVHFYVPVIIELNMLYLRTIVTV
jgi:hypothetical protein